MKKVNGQIILQIFRDSNVCLFPYSLKVGYLILIQFASLVLRLKILSPKPGCNNNSRSLDATDMAKTIPKHLIFSPKLRNIARGGSGRAMGYVETFSKRRRFLLARKKQIFQEHKRCVPQETYTGSGGHDEANGTMPLCLLLVEHFSWILRPLLGYLRARSAIHFRHHQNHELEDHQQSYV